MYIHCTYTHLYMYMYIHVETIVDTTCVCTIPDLFSCASATVFLMYKHPRTCTPSLTCNMLILFLTSPSPPLHLPSPLLLSSPPPPHSPSPTSPPPLHSVVTRALNYLLLLSSEMHREAWTPVLLLCFTRLLQLTPQQVCPVGRPKLKTLSRRTSLIIRTS